ncbi:MAG: hypothetical protein A3I00_05490 [Betaproteobacteria bacterium RIFCSPLOWO2_02_FULL_64_12]|nr:MAG: hypothetical protein A3I00_05490 [Betaproteobacteria bacterium RIFCSPLOWO2_02_FULL_64_12]
MTTWRIGPLALHALWLWAPIASGAYRGWPFAVALALVAVALAARFAEMLAARRLEWRRTSLDLPFALLGGLFLVQLVFGNRALLEWSLGPPPSGNDLHVAFPSPFLLLGTASPDQSARSFLLFVAYVAVYYLVVNFVDTRRDTERVLRTLVVGASLLATLGLIDYLSREAWLLPWRTDPYGSRLSGTFANADHFAAWLTMATLLGIGWQMSRLDDLPGAPSVREIATSRELREAAVRRYLPLVAIGVLMIATIFTLSRGGLIGLLSGLIALAALLGMCRRIHRGMLSIGALILVVLAYGAWIGFAPLLARVGVSPESAIDRLTQYAASLPMLRDFPLLGVGLGAYRDVYLRYQPLAHRPHEVYYPYAHNDILQLLLESGILGAALVAFAFWRVAADLVGAHVMGRTRCPVRGRELESDRRYDRQSLAVGTAALAGLVAITAHSALDFSLRIPANGFLAATLLGLATTSLHIRGQPGRERSIAARRHLHIAGRGWVPVAGSGLALALLVIGWGMLGARATHVDTRVDSVGWPTSLEDAEAILAVDPRHVTALQRRATARQQQAVAVWTSAAASRDTGDPTATARGLLGQGRQDLRTALLATPTNPNVHAQLAWLEAVDAEIADPARARVPPIALSHAARALVLAPENPGIYESVARLTVSRIDLSIPVAREAVRRDAARLGSLVQTYRTVGLTEAEWLALVPESAVDRLDLAIRLEDQRLFQESVTAYRAAAALAPRLEAPLYEWMLAQALARGGRAEAAQLELERALAADPTSPELHRALGEVLAQRGDPAALRSLRAAVAAAERVSSAPPPRNMPFHVATGRLASLLEKRATDLSSPVRYRRALARYLVDRAVWSEAVDELRGITRELPEDATARFLLGTALDGIGAADEALQEFRRAVDLAPRETRFRARLARHLWSHEGYVEAVAEWRTVKAQAPDDIDARLALAGALEKLGERFGAFTEYREVLELRPAHPEAVRGLARVRSGVRITP